MDTGCPSPDSSRPCRGLAGTCRGLAGAPARDEGAGPVPRGVEMAEPTCWTPVLLDSLSEWEMSSSRFHSDPHSRLCPARTLPRAKGLGYF